MSLITTASRDLARCPSCASTKVTAISMTLTDGSRVDFCSCHVCEHKGWRQGPTALPVETVLAKAKKHR